MREQTSRRAGRLRSDAPGDTFRDEMLEDYKAAGAAPPDPPAPDKRTSSVRGGIVLIRSSRGARFEEDTSSPRGDPGGSAGARR